MEELGLLDIEKEIVDTLVNIPQAYAPSDLSETVSIVSSVPRPKIEESIDLLVTKGAIVKSDGRLGLNAASSTQVMEAVREHLMNKSVSIDSTTALLDKGASNQVKLSSYITLLGKIYRVGQSKGIYFSDGEWNMQPGPFADELVKLRLAFQTSSQSKKHSYRSYYLRSWPFDAEEVLRKIVFKHLKVEGLNPNEWRVILLLLLCKYSQVEYDAVRQNVACPEHELREVITGLKSRGLIKETYNQVELPQALRTSLSDYYMTDIYPKFRAETVAALKNVIVRSLSNLWPFTIAKRIAELPDVDIRTSPFTVASVDKSRVVQYEPQFQGIKTLGLLVELKDDVIIFSDILRDVENWLKSSVKRPASFIPAKDMWLARSVIQAMFAQCKEYVKIQDTFIGEDTFHLLGYVPGEVELQLMTGIAPGGHEEPARMAQVIERFAAERNGKFKVYFLSKSRHPLFHDRFILTKNKGWSTGTSLKDIGKEDDTSIFEITEGEKDELYEPAFDKWWDADSSELAKKGIKKLDFVQWKNHQKASA